MAEMRLHGLGEEQFEAAIPTLVGACRRRSADAETVEGHLEVVGRGSEGIDAGVCHERLSAAEPLDAVGPEHPVPDPVEQIGRAGDGGTGLVPFEEDEFEIVMISTLARAEGPGKLIDRPGTERQESLHEEFRACLQVAILGPHPHANRLDVRLGHDLGPEDRCVHLDEPTGVEERGDGASDPHAPFEEIPQRHARVRPCVTRSRSSAGGRPPRGRRAPDRVPAARSPRRRFPSAAGACRCGRACRG